MKAPLIGLAAAFASMLAATGCPVHARDYPTKPVKIVVPFPAGGAVDVIARIIAQGLSESLDGKFVVENLPGAGGDIGTVAVAAAPADGHTMLFVAPDFVTSPLVKAKPAFDPLKSFAPVTLAASAQEVIVVHPSVPASTIKELLAVLKGNSSKHSMAIPGYGTLGHLEGIRLFALSHGLQVPYVPFQGMGPAVTSTLGGHTTVLFAPIALVAGNLKDGQLRALAVEGGKRSPILPDVPTLAEAGIPNHESEFATGALVPAGTSKHVIDLLHGQIARIMTLSETRARLATLGFDPVASSPDAFTAWIETETAKWAPVVRQANVKIN